MIPKDTGMKEMPKNCLINKHELEKTLLEAQSRKSNNLQELFFFDAVLAIIDNIPCVDPLKIRYEAERADNGEIVKGFYIKAYGKHFILDGEKANESNHSYLFDYTEEIKPETLKIVLDGEEE